MARYAGVDERNPPRILGYLQHGWNILDGFAVGTNLLPGLAKFVWSDGPRRRGWSMGRRDYMVVGAPWNYLLALEPEPAPERKGTIWYPFHGWEGQQILGDHNRLIAQIREVEVGPVTACLYFNEFRNPRHRSPVSLQAAGRAPPAPPGRVEPPGQRDLLWHFHGVRAVRLR
jgi:hypothetical protein